MLFSGMAFTSLPAYKALSNVSAAGSEVLKVVTPFEEACYSYMQIPWLCIALWGAVAVLLFVLSVIIHTLNVILPSMQYYIICRKQGNGQKSK